MSVTSSVTPCIAENSCKTPLIRTDVIAAPCSEDRRILLKELPRVVPKPRSNGSAKNLPYVSESDSFSNCNCFGLIRSRQFLYIRTSSGGNRPALVGAEYKCLLLRYIYFE